MNMNRRWFVGALPALTLFLLAGCAAPPAKEAIASLDYGSCPQNFEATIKDYFQGAMLSKYSDELIMWPPQKHWYRSSPLTGNKLQAGFLVPVMADQTFGPQMTGGKHIYGFIFKNGDLTETLNPMLMQSHSIKEAVGPIPLDKRDWKVGYSNTNSNPVIIEYVLPGETVQNWSELISVQIVSPIGMNVSAGKFVSDIAAQHKEREPRCANVSQKILSSTPTEVLYEQTLENCAPMRDEYSIRKAVRAPRSLTEVSYTKTTALSDDERAKWTEILGKTTMMGDCAQRP